MNYKKLAGTMGVVALLSPSTVIESEAYNTILYYAVASGDKPVKAYEKVGDSGYRWIIEQDRVLPIYEMTIDGWCRVVYGGEDCWVFRSDMKNVAQFDDKTYYAVGKESIDVYDGIHPYSKIIGTIKKGDKVIASGDSAYLFDDNGKIEDEFVRVKISNDDRKYKYIPKRYLETSKKTLNEETVINKKTYKYNAPTDSALSKGKVNEGSKVTVLSYMNGYVKVMYDKDVFYVKESSLGFEPKYMYLDRSKVEKTTVYSKASSSSKKLGTIYSDYARYVTDVIDGYAKITYSGKTGYVKYNTLRDKRMTETMYLKDKVNVKENHNGGSAVGKLKKGAKVTVLGYRNDSVRIQSGNVKGYVSKKVLSKTKPIIIEPKYMYLDRTKVEKATVYSKASSSSKKLGTIYSDYARYVTDVIDGYAKITYSGKTGYVKYNTLRDKRMTEIMYLKDKVNVKESHNGGSTVGKLKKGAKVTVLGYRNDSVRIQSGNVKGYVPKKVLSKTKPIIIEPKYMYLDRTKVEKATVYSKASSSSKKLGTIYSDYARYVTDVIDGYAKITYSGKTGYVKYNTLRDKRMTETMYLSSNVDVKENHNGGSTVGKLKKCTEVVVLGYRNDFARIKCGNVKGYVKVSVLSKSKLMYLDVLNNENTTVDTRYSNTDKANVYKDKSLKDPVGFLAKGDKVKFISKTSDGVSRVKINDELTGYIDEKHLSYRNPLAKNTSSVVTKTLSITHEEYVDSQANNPYATIEEIKKYSNPKQYSLSNNEEKYQFLKIDSFKNINVYELNEYLNNLKVQNGQTAIFKNQAQAFVNAARKNNIDPIYLVAHTLLETGRGSSQLAQGIVVTEDPSGNSIEPTKVHNLFGIGAVDKDANGQGSKVAYALGWTSIPKAISGAAKWIATGVKADKTVGLSASQGYIHSKKFTEQYTLYSMRWDYVYGWHQYASDPGWALKISRLMNELSYLYEGANLVFENIEYKKSPKIELLSEIGQKEVAKKAILRSGPSKNFRVLGELEAGSVVDVKGRADGYSIIVCNGEEFYVEESSLREVSTSFERGIKEKVEIKLYDKEDK